MIRSSLLCSFSERLTESTMQRSSLLCSSSSFYPSPAALSTSNRFAPPAVARPTRHVVASVRLHFTRIRNYRNRFSSLFGTATKEVLEVSEDESGFIEVGYLSSAHGLQGEICVKPSTDFPELRFAEPGIRWLRLRFSGRETIQEVELVEGRGYPGQKTWILKFGGIDTVEQAKQLVGSSLLVREDDRPELEEGEFYSRDLVGMRVTLKESGEPVGTVVNVFSTAANDLLEVMLDPVKRPGQTGNPKSETGVSGPLVWVPFVEAIVPNVDVNKREMQITPPKGLLELNLRSDERSKKERRQLEWKERKKFQKRLVAAKKKLSEMEQQHVFHGFRFGQKAQRSLLADQIVGVNSKLLQLALQSIELSSQRWSSPEFISDILSKLGPRILRVSQKCITTPGSEEKLDSNFKLQEKGLHLMSKGKMAIVLFVNDGENHGRYSDAKLVDSESTGTSLLQTLLSDDRTSLKDKDRVSVPLIIVSPSHEVHSLEKLFSDHDYFACDPKKVWFLEDEKLPVISNSLGGENTQKILMKSPWEILQTSVGSGGVFSLLSSEVLDNLSEMGVEYIKICSLKGEFVISDLLLGLVSSLDSDVGIQISEGMEDIEKYFDVIFSMRFMKKLTKQMNKLQFYGIPKLNSHVEMVHKEWVDVNPSSPNSLELGCSIYSSLNACSLDKVCAMEIRE